MFKEVDILEPLDASEEQKRRVRAFYDQERKWKGTVYDDASERFNRLIIRRKLYAVEMLKQLTGLKRGTALDIGCGCGEYISELTNMGFAAYGIELSEEMLKACRVRLRFDEPMTRERLRQGDIEAIPFGDEKFDLVLCAGVMGYLLDEQKALGEISRVLRRGGYALIIVQNMISLSNIDYLFRIKLRSLLTKARPAKIPASSSGVSMCCPWIPNHAAIPHQYKLYHPWKFERLMRDYGFDCTDAMTLGHEFRIVRRFKLLPELLLTKTEVMLEKLFRATSIPYLSYAGESYIGLFHKR